MKWLQLRTCLLLVGILLLAGCESAHRASGRPLTAGDVEASRSGKKALVLFRITNPDPQSQESLDYLNRVRWRFRDVTDWSHPEERSVPRSPSHWRVPSESLGKEGWRYLLLEPGRYMMEIAPGKYQRLGFSTYHLNVPSGAKLVYAGSFEIVPTDTGMAGVPPEPAATNKVVTSDVRDETAAARETAAVLGTSPGALETILAVPNDLAVALQPFGNPTVIGFESKNHPPHSTREVGNKLSSMAAAPFVVGGAVIVIIGACLAEIEDQSSDHEASLIVMGTGAGLIAAAVPVWGVAYLTIGNIPRLDWISHQNALEKEIAKFDLAHRIAASVETALVRTNLSELGTNTANGLALRVEITRIGLVSDDFFAWEYIFEIEAHLSVIDPRSNAVIWEHGFVSGRQDRKHIPRYSTRLGFPAPVRPLDDFKGPAGREHVREILQAAADHFSEDMVHCLRAAGF